MTVTFVVVSEVLGGGELFALRLAESVAAAGCRVAIAGVPGTPVMEEADRRGIQQERLNIGKKLGRKSVWRNLVTMPVARGRLEALIQGKEARDWIIFQYTWEKLLWRGSAKDGNIAVMEHGPIPRPLINVPIARHALRRTYRRCDALFAASEPARRDVRQLSGRNPKMLRAGVDHGAVFDARQRATSLRAELNMEPNAPLLAYAGRIAKNKGVFGVLAVVRRNPSLTAVIVGDGPEMEDLLVEARDLGDRVRVLGRVDDALPYLAAADLTCLFTSDPGEGRPLLAIESLSVGTPVLGNRSSPAMVGLVREGLDGLLLVDMREPSLIDEAVQQALAVRPVHVPLRSWKDVAEELLAELRRKGGQCVC